MSELPDIQQTQPKIKSSIAQVGVESVDVPFMLECKNSGFLSMVASVSMRAYLDENTKGISMSRCIRTLQPYLSLPLNNALCLDILKALKNNLEVTESYMTFKFKMPIVRKSIKSDNEFPVYHECMFEGHLVEEDGQDKFRFFQGVKFQYASYCPCSAALCNDLGEGFPHAQRSFANIVTEIDLDNPNKVWLEDLLSSSETAIKTLPYPIIKREDEQEIARIAGQNPIFVEDAIRSISAEIDSIPAVRDWVIKCIHEESIHSSEAIAVNYKGLSDGFNYRYVL